MPRSAAVLPLLLLLACPAWAADRVAARLACTEALNEDRAASLLGRWDLDNLNPKLDAGLVGPEQALFVPSAEVDRQIAAMAAAGDIPEDDLEAAAELLARVANASAPAYRHKLSSLFMVAANPATNLAVGYDVFQDEGQPLYATHVVGVACPQADGSIEWQAWTGSGLMLTRFYEEGGKQAATLGVLSSGLDTDRQHSEPWAYYGNPYYKVDAPLAKVLPELAGYLRAANHTGET